MALLMKEYICVYISKNTECTKKLLPKFAHGWAAAAGGWRPAGCGGAPQRAPGEGKGSAPRSCREPPSRRGASPRPLRLARRMVDVIQGVLVECDPPLKQYLLALDDRETVKFVVDKLPSDDRALFVNPSAKGFVDEKIAELYDKYSADPRDDREDKRRAAAGGGAGGKRKAR